MSAVINSTSDLVSSSEPDYLQTFYNSLVEAAGNVFFVTDHNGYFVYVNSAIEPVLGFKPTQIIGKYFTEVVHPDWQKQVAEWYTDQFNNAVAETTREFEVVGADGEKHWVEQIVRLMIVDGKVMGCNGLLHDITPRKRAEAERQQVEQVYLAAAENSGAVVYMVAPGGTLAYANPAMECATGYTRSELIGTSIFKLVHPDHHEELREYVRLHQAGIPSTPRSEIRFVRKDGAICWLDVVATWGEMDGKVTLYVSALDISHRKEMEQRLHESQFFVEQINKTIPDLVYVYDLELSRLVYSNRRIGQDLGYSGEEIAQMGEDALSLILIPKDDQHFDRGIFKLNNLKPGEIQEGTYQMPHKDGRLRWMHIRNTVFLRDNAGQIKQLLGLARDVTAQMEAEEHLRQSLQYQRALAEINFELNSIDTFEGMCRRAVELGHSKLGFDRIGLLLYDHTTEVIRGCFGIDAQGNIRDERGITQPLAEGLKWVNKSMRSKQRVRVREDVDLYDNWQVVGHGWNAMALLWKDDHVMGWLAVDNLINHEPLHEYQPEILGMLAISLEHFCIQKEAEAKLRESNRRYDQLVANMPGMVYRVRRTAAGDAFYEYISPRCKELTGYDPEEVLANATLLLDQMVPEDRARYDALVQINLANPQLFHWEGAVIVNGERRWRRVESRPYKLPDGSMVWDGILTDVTESHRAEEALRQSEERYRTMVEQHSEMITRYTPDGILTFVNESACRFFGQPRDYFMGRSILQDVPSEYHAALVERIQRAKITGQTFQYEHPIKMSNGSLRWFEWTDTPIFDTNGQVKNFQSVGRDIDIRKRTETERNEYINRLEIIRRVDMELNESLNFDHVLQIALDAAMRISHATAGAIHVLESDHLRVAHVVGNFPHSMVGSTLPLTTGIVGRVARRAIPELVSDVNLDPDYLPSVVDTRAQMTLPLMSQDRLIGVINVQTSKADVFTRSMFDFLKVLTVRIASALDNARLHSITEHHLAEITDLYQQVSELEQLKTQMIRIAAHDLRNPLGVISGYVQMLSEQMEEHLSEQNHEQVQMIRDSISRIDKITRDILTLERIAAGREMAADQIDFTQMVTEAYNLTKGQAALKKQLLILDTPDSRVFVKGDRFLLPETIINLITNAIKYTPEGGNIRVQVSAKDHKAIVTVSDNGYGIPEEQQAGLFQPFYRVKTKETRGITGTGLGLHLVKSIIERHKGQMYFQSRYGQGSTFGFEIPGVEAPTSHSKRKASATK